MPEPRDRSPAALTRVLAFWGASVLVLVATSISRGFLPPLLAPLAWGLLGSLATWRLVAWFLRTERRPVTDAGLGWSPRTPLVMLAGALIGVGTYALTLAASAAVLGPIRLLPATSPAWTTVAVTVCGIAALVVMEELVFRSYALWTAVRAIGIWPAQILVALAFGLLHLAYGWPMSAVLLGVVPSALLFGVAAVVSRGLALPCGVHLGINLARWCTGEGAGAGFWTLDTQALDPGRAATLAPVLGALAPVIVAAVLYRSWPNRHATL